MDIGLALPQYDYPVPGREPLDWATTVAWAQRAEAAGFASVWLADHLFMSIEKYGGAPGRHPGFDPLVGLSALARATTRVRLGPLVLATPLRAPAVTAKFLAGLDRLAGGRLIVGVGAGWLEEEFVAAGVPFRRPGLRLEFLAEAIDVYRGMWQGEPLTYSGAHVQVSAAPCLPPPRQEGGPPLWVGGRGDRLLDVAARKGDGWNTVWEMTPERYRDRLAVLEAACARHGRDPASVQRSIGLYALVGEDEADLAARYRRMQAQSPRGVLDGVGLEEWRKGHLVGTPEQVREQVATWSELGVSHLIAGLGAVPFGPAHPDDLIALAEGLKIGEPDRSPPTLE